MMKTFSEKFGVLLIILSIIGLIFMATLPWFEYKDGEKETYLLSEFGKKFKDHFGDEYDEYYSGSAYLAVYGFALLIVLGVVLLVPLLRELGSKLVKGISQSAQKTMLGALLFIPATFILVSGTRFVGLVSLLNAQAKVNNVPLTYSSSAGWAMLILGILAFVFGIYLILKNMLRTKINKLSLLISILCVIGLVSMPVLAFLTVKFEIGGGYGEYQVERKVTEYVNDGDIHVYAKKSYPDEVRHAYEKMSGDLTLIGICFVLGMLFSIVALAGTQINSRYTNLMISLGCVTLILCLLIFIGYVLFVSHVSELNDVFGKLTRGELGAAGAYAGVSATASFGSNNIPLIACTLAAIASFIYCLEVYPTHVVKLFGRGKSSSDQ